MNVTRTTYAIADTVLPQHPLWPAVNYVVAHPLPVAVGFIVFIAVFTWVWKKPLSEWYIINRGQQLPTIKSLRQQAWTNIRMLEWKEDIYPIVRRPQKLAQNPKIQKFTWQRWTKLLTLITVVHLLTPLAAIPHEYSYIAVTVIILFLWIGILRHTRKVNLLRKQIMQQMFDVAASEMKYPSGAEQAIAGYIQVQEWEYVYTPLTTVIMYPPKYRSDSETNREHFERAFNAVVSDQHTWTYEWEPSNNKVTATPVPYIPEQAVLPFPDNKPYNIIPLGIALGNEEVEVDLTVAPHALIVGTTGSGKDLTLDTPIPVPATEHHLDGWTTMGELSVGDRVFDEKGNVCRVTGVSDVIRQDNLYEIVFSDGSTVQAGKDHMWWVERQEPSAGGRLSESDRVFTEKVRTLSSSCPVEAEITFHQFAQATGLPRQHPLLQYAADSVGHVGEIRFLPADSDTPLSTVKTYPAKELFRELSRPLVNVSWRGQVRTTENIFYDLDVRAGVSNFRVPVAGPLNLPEVSLPESPFTVGRRLAAEDRENLCAGRLSIPSAYLRASIRQRRELLAGFGLGEGGESLPQTYHSERLAADVCEVLLSLGYSATVSETVNSAGEWVVTVSGDENFRHIVKIRRIPAASTKCIQVDSPRRLFLAGRNMIPTHNSVTQRTILIHCLQHPSWRIVLVDPKRVELSMYESAENVVEVATELETMVEAISKVETMMHERYKEMKEAGVNHFLSLPDPPPAVMLMVDETYNLLAPEGIKSDEGKERDALHAQAAGLIGSIARLGRAAGVHMVLATQRPDAKVIPGETRNNLDCRIAQGKMMTTASLMALDSDHATRLSEVKGRAMVRVGNKHTEFQAYFVPPEDVDKAIVVCNALALGHLTPEDLLGTGDAESAEDNSGKSGRVGRLLSPLMFWRRFGKKNDEDDYDEDEIDDRYSGSEKADAGSSARGNLLTKIPGVSGLVRWYRKREASLEDEENRSGGEDDDLGDLHYGDNIREDARYREERHYYDDENDDEEDEEEELSQEDFMRMLAELEDDEDEEDDDDDDDDEGFAGRVERAPQNYDDDDDDDDLDDVEPDSRFRPAAPSQDRISVSPSTASPGGVKFTVALDAPDVEVLKSSLFLREIISMYGIAGQPIPFTEFLSALEQEISSLEEAERQLENRSPGLSIDELKPADAEVPPPGGWEIYEEEDDEEEDDEVLPSASAPSLPAPEKLSSPNIGPAARNNPAVIGRGTKNFEEDFDDEEDVDDFEEDFDDDDENFDDKVKYDGEEDGDEDEEEDGDEEEFLLELKRLREESGRAPENGQGSTLTASSQTVEETQKVSPERPVEALQDHYWDDDDEWDEDDFEGEDDDEDEPGLNVQNPPYPAGSSPVPAETQGVGFFDFASPPPPQPAPAPVKDTGDDDAEGWEEDDDDEWGDNWVEEVNARRGNGYTFGNPAPVESTNSEGSFDNFYSMYMTLLDQDDPAGKKKRKKKN